MPGRTIEASPQEWEELARRVIDRRHQLGITQQQAASRAVVHRISLPVWSILENASQKNGRMTITALRGASEALRWVPTACEDFLRDGIEPQVADADLEVAEIDLNSAAAELTPDERRAVLDFIAEQRRKQRS